MKELTELSNNLSEIVSQLKDIECNVVLEYKDRCVYARSNNELQLFGWVRMADKCEFEFEYYRTF